MNDRHLQELVGKAYLHLMSKNIGYISEKIIDNNIHLTNTKRKARVGFISKFFAIFEPHGLLLDGVMKYLPRTEFEVIALPVARTDPKVLYEY